jgi:hypothetical protein
MNRNFVSKLPFPQGDYLEDTSSRTQFISPYFDHIVRTLKQNYSQEYCNSVSVQNQTMKFCGCSNVYLPICKNMSKFCSFNNIEDYMCACKLKSVYGNDFETLCFESCPFECFSIEYIFKVYTSMCPIISRFDGLFYNHGCNRSISDYKYGSQAFVIVYYYESMTYTKIY